MCLIHHPKLQSQNEDKMKKKEQMLVDIYWAFLEALVRSFIRA
jgi:hypothetical protein